MLSGTSSPLVDMGMSGIEVMSTPSTEGMSQGGKVRKRRISGDSAHYVIHCKDRELCRENTDLATSMLFPDSEPGVLRLSDLGLICTGIQKSFEQRPLSRLFSAPILLRT